MIRPRVPFGADLGKQDPQDYRAVFGEMVTRLFQPAGRTGH